MDLEGILNVVQPFVIMFAALLAAFLTAVWISVVLWTFRDIRARTRDVFAQILATIMVLIFFPFFPFPGLILYFLLRPRETLAEVYERSLEEEALLQGIEERLACPGCNRRIQEEYMVCPTCHTRLKKACPACGRLLHLRWNICPYCGAVQTTAKAALPLGAQQVAMPLEPATATPRLSSTATAAPFQPAADNEPEPWAEVAEEQPTSAEPEPWTEVAEEQPASAEPEPWTGEADGAPVEDEPEPWSETAEEQPGGAEPELWAGEVKDSPVEDEPEPRAEETGEQPADAEPDTDSERAADTLPFEFD